MYLLLPLASAQWNRAVTCESAGCGPGTYCWNTNPDTDPSAVADYQCFSCTEGKYTPQSNYKSCVDCEEGKTSGAGARSCYEPLECIPGQVRLGGICADCTPGTYSTEVNSLSCLKCFAGRYTPYVKSTQCFDCPTGRYGFLDSIAAHECEFCPSGWTSKNQVGGISTDSEAYLTACEECPPGQYGSNSGHCVDCPAGRFQPNSRSTDCAYCVAGKYSNSGASVCTDCDAGKYRVVEGNECTDCEAGTYSTSGASVCTDCDAGEYSNSGASVCTDCDAGRYSNSSASVCTGCVAGRYSNSGASVCEFCAAGKYSNSGASECIDCDAGKYFDIVELMCIDCRAGTYSNSGASVCTDCGAGKYSSITGATTHTVCKYCVEGKYSSKTGANSASECQDCTKGKYQNKKGMTECKNCYRGLFQDQTGKQSCEQCPKGTYATDNIVATGNSTQCTSCPAGFYSNILGLFGNLCAGCPKGTYSTAGSTSCTYCEAGRYQDEIDKSSCKDCPKNTYSEGVGNIYEDQCIRCDTGKKSNSGSTNSNECVDCPIGKYMYDDCTECPQGQYQDQQGQGSCKICNNIRSQFENSTGLTSSDSCDGCEAGKYFHEGLPSNGCQDCPSGKYSNKGHIERGTDFTIEPCLSCPDDTIYEEYTYKNGASVVLPRTVDRCKKCPYSTYYQGGHCLSCSLLELGDTRCECPQGKIFNGEYCSNDITCQAGQYLSCTDTAVTTQYEFPNGTKATQAHYDNNLAYAIYTGVEEECECVECPLAYKSSWSSTQVQTWSEGGYQRTCHAPKNCQYSYERNKCTEDGCECDVCDGDLNSIFGGKYSVNCHNKCNGSIGLQGNQLQVKATCGCDEGYYVKSNGCHKCPDGQWSAGGRVTECKSCAKNQKRSGNVCEPCPDGYYSDGGNVQECKKLCGVGETSNGTNCETCDGIEAPSCTMVAGDSTGGSNVKVGEANSEQECFNLVRSTEPDANGATMQIGGGECWAEFNVSGTVELAGWKTCKFEPVQQRRTSQGKECYVADYNRQNTCGNGEIDTNGDCHECREGWWFNGTGCRNVCNTGESDTGSGCQSCPSSLTSNGKGCAVPVYFIRISDRPTDCDDNEYNEGGSCVACEDGKNSTGGNVYQCFSNCSSTQYNDGVGDCQECLDGEEGGGFRTWCLKKCGKGQRNSYSGCVDCYPGTWSDGGYVEECYNLDCNAIDPEKIDQYRKKVCSSV